MRLDQDALLREARAIATEDSSRSEALLRTIVESDARTRAWAEAALDLAKRGLMFAERAQEVLSLTDRILEQPPEVASRLAAATAGIIGAGVREELGAQIDEPRLRAWVDDALAEGATLYAAQGHALLARRHESRGEEDQEIQGYERAAALYAQARVLFSSAKVLSRVATAFHKRGEYEQTLLVTERALARLDGEPQLRHGVKLRRELLELRRRVQESLGVKATEFYPRYYSVGGVPLVIDLDKYGSPRFLTHEAGTGELKNDYRYAAVIHEGGEHVRSLDSDEYRALVASRKTDANPTRGWTRFVSRADLKPGNTFLHGTSRLAVAEDDLAAFVDSPGAVLAFGFRALTPGDPFEKSFPVWMACIRRDSVNVALLERLQRLFPQLVDAVSLAHLMADLCEKAASLGYQWLAVTSALREPMLAPALKVANIGVELTPMGAARIRV
jgi:tetratricopeptide (TPR) repeat protein